MKTLTAAMLFFVLIQSFAVCLLTTRLYRKFTVVIPVIFVLFYFQLLHFFSRPMYFAPELPDGLFLIGAWLFATGFFLFPMLTFFEFVYRIAMLFRKKIPDSVCKRICLGLCCTAILLSTYAVWRTMTLPKIKEVSLSFPTLPKSADGMRIAILSDFHTDRSFSNDGIKNIIRRTNALKPDLILLLGDFVDGSVRKFGKELKQLTELSAPLGVYAVSGNHEYYPGNEGWIGFLSFHGIKFLVNENLTLPNGVVLAGIPDLNANSQWTKTPNIMQALSGTTPENFRILMVHQPKLAKIANSAGVSLMLSGNTHGGIIYGIDSYVAAGNGGFISGIYSVENMKLYISSGITSWSAFPLRMKYNSEITLLKLSCGTQEELQK